MLEVTQLTRGRALTSAGVCLTPKLLVSLSTALPWLPLALAATRMRTVRACCSVCTLAVSLSINPNIRRHLLSLGGQSALPSGCRGRGGRAFKVISSLDQTDH